MVAGSFTDAAVRTCPTHTPPSPVRTNTASWLRNTTVPGSPGRAGPAGRRTPTTARRTRWCAPPATRRRPRCDAGSLGRIGPRELAVHGPHRRPQLPGHVGPGVVQRLRGERRIRRLGDDLTDQLDRGVSDRPVVHDALAPVRGQRERAGGPDRAGVHLLHRLQRGHPPLRRAGQQRPVQRRRPPIALRTRMHDDRPVPRPHLGRTRSRRNGQMIRSGSNNPTAETIASALVANSTVTS